MGLVRSDANGDATAVAAAGDDGQAGYDDGRSIDSHDANINGDDGCSDKCCGPDCDDHHIYRRFGICVVASGRADGRRHCLGRQSRAGESAATVSSALSTISATSSLLLQQSAASSPAGLDTTTTSAAHVQQGLRPTEYILATTATPQKNKLDNMGSTTSRLLPLPVSSPADASIVAEQINTPEPMDTFSLAPSQSEPLAQANQHATAPIVAPSGASQLRTDSPIRILPPSIPSPGIVRSPVQVATSLPATVDIAFSQSTPVATTIVSTRGSRGRGSRARTRSGRRGASSVVTRDTPRTRQMQKFLPPTRAYAIYRCEWQGCGAQLHNLATLQKHVHLIHYHDPERIDERNLCRWTNCFDIAGRRLKFDTEAAREEHVMHVHVEPLRAIFGDGPDALKHMLLHEQTNNERLKQSLTTPLVFPAFDGFKFESPPADDSAWLANINDQDAVRALCNEMMESIGGAGWESDA
ncbi:uncharacterized protein V1518DRAFT_130448 [Limtongia smithiae]|uniref:uncharacterized protein n=1 Tax=Limtongia smithiae TaxID=1125753 RepID=UPI0034CF0957